MSLKSFFKITGKSIFLLLGGAVIGTFLMIGCFMIPMERISDHVAESVPVFTDEGLYPKLFPWWLTSLDNFTDVYMLMKASYIGDEPLVDKAMVVYSTHYEDEDLLGSLVTWCSPQKSGKVEKRYGYARYWHGYLVFLKPLLLFLNYKGIRIFNFLLQFILTYILVYSLYKKGKSKLIIPYLLAVLLLDPIAVACSMQFSTCFYLFTIASIIVVRKFEWLCFHDRCFYLFLLIGMATSYVDFLTYPISTLGVPLIFYVILGSNKKEWKRKVREIIILSAGWAAGYAGMWGLKWIIGSALSSQNIIKDALEQVKFRLSMSETAYTDGTENKRISIFLLYAYNIGALVLKPVIVFGIWYIIVYAKKFIKNRKNIRFILRNGIPLFLIALMPFVWYLVLSNHSWIHYWFTNKALVVSAFAFFAFISQEASGYE